MDRPTDLAIACTLSGDAFIGRLASIAELNRRALRTTQRNDLRLELAYDADVLDEVERLADRERSCCAFLDFRVRAEGGQVRLTITAPEAAREVLDLLFQPFQSSAPAASAEAGCSCGPGAAA